MNIAIFINSLSSGGAERVVSYLLPYLLKKGHTVHLILMSTNISYVIPEEVTLHYIEKAKNGESGIYKFIKLPFLALKYGRLMTKLKITHSFSLLSRPNYVNLVSRSIGLHKTKVIISERNYPSLQYGYKDIQSKINSFLVRWLYPKADLIIGNSEANVADLIDNFGIDEIATSVIQNPIDIESIEEKKGINDFFDHHQMNLVTVGRLEPQKNYNLLIDIMERVPKIKLFILGKGMLEDTLKQRVAQKNLRDRIVFLGYSSNPYEYLKKADLFIFGSNHEGFPNVILEAMSCGLPILTTNCKSGPDEIMDLKEASLDDIMITPNGILAPVGNLELMIKGLEYFMQNPDYMLSCRENVRQRIKVFAKEEILKKYEAVLTSVL